MRTSDLLHSLLRVTPLALICTSNAAQAGGFGSTVGGGIGNQAIGDFSTVSGGTINAAGGQASVVSGGYHNLILGSADTSVIAGGRYNEADGELSTISGGEYGWANGRWATISGGGSNYAAQSASVGGGEHNLAIGIGATISGGVGNDALGEGSIVPGGTSNQADGDYSFAAGTGARVRSGDDHTFIWSDGSLAPLLSTGPSQFMVSAKGGVAFNSPPINANVAMTITAPAGNPLYSSILLRGANANDGILISSGDAISGGNNASFYVDQYNGGLHSRRLSLDATGKLLITNQAYKPGGGSWAASSDARLKTNVQPLGHALDRMLALKGVTFEYAHPDSEMHPAGTFSGFIAQDVEKVFPNWIGHDNDGYLTVGPQGFEAITVEAVRELKTSQDDRVAKLEHDNADLRALVANQTKAISDLRHEMAAITSTVDLKFRQVADASGTR